MKIGSQDSGAGTVVGANVRLQGTLKDTNDITVHGVVEGEVISGMSIIISESATVKGPIVGEVITIAGTIKGSIEAKEKLEILPTGKVNGSIISKTLIINSGAQFNGKSQMSAEGKTTETNEPESNPTEKITKESEEIAKKSETNSFEIE